MYCTPSDIISAACGHAAYPTWSNAYLGASLGKPHRIEGASPRKSDCIEGVDKLLMGQGVDKLLDRASQCLVPAYIAYGLIECLALEQRRAVDQAGKGKGCNVNTSSKESLAPPEQELYQEVLRKLALHLAAQPDTEQETLQAAAHQNLHRDETQPLEQESLTAAPGHSTNVLQEAAPHMESRSCGETGDCTKRLVDTKAHSLSLQEQEFQREMLRKLALHLAAQDEEESHNREEEQMRSKSTNGVTEGITTPDVFPATPSSFGEEQCEQFYIGDDQDHGAEEICQCWPSDPQGVWVPTDVAYGLLHGIFPGQEGPGSKPVVGNRHVPNPLKPHDQALHLQMLQKLALHLAAQPDPLHVPSKKGSHRGETSRSESKVAWADVTDDVDEPHGAREAFEANTHRNSANHREGASTGKEAMGKQLLSHSSQSRPECQDFHQQMLQKLALHLAAQPDAVEKPQLSTESSKTAHISGKHRQAGATRKVPEVAPNLKPEQQSPEQQEFRQEMLQKLALHLAAQPAEERCEEVTLESVSEATALGKDKARCDILVAELERASESSGAARAARIMEWVLPHVRTLSFTQGGCRLVQKVVDAASVSQREQLLRVLVEDFPEVYSSPHANHVVAKVIDVLPARSLTTIVDALRGKATVVARHQYGSRILERLIVHCGEDHVGFLVGELVDDIEALARHQFGNFVVACILEHGTAARKRMCVQNMLPHVLHHATHKTACNIVQRMLDHTDLACQAMIADVFLAGSGGTSLESIAATRYGSFVIQHLVDRFHPRIDAVKLRVKAAHPQLQASAFSQRKIVQFLGEAFFRD